MVVYADTSFLFSLYAQDANTSAAAALAADVDLPFLCTPLQWHELRNAVRLSLFRRDIDDVQAGRTFADIEGDLAAGVLRHTVVGWDEVFRCGEELGARHTPAVGTRSLDVLHVACALTLECPVFLTFDHRQAILAAEAGLSVRP